jgi:cyclopropane fatty-acyl-phospholipid synthase-like methyltransferase
VNLKGALFRVGVHVAIRALTARGTYQPVMLGGRCIAAGRRGTQERLDALMPSLKEVGASSVIDHGCAEGYMVRRLVENGYFVLGIDDSPRALTTAQLSLTADGVRGWGLLRMRLDGDSVRLLPEMDATISLSVMHHTMYTHGPEYARRMLAVIRERTRKVLIFEMGQSDEHAFGWASRLPDMGTEPHDWIAGFLESAGYTETRVICKVPSFNSTVQRATFAAYV